MSCRIRSFFVFVSWLFLLGQVAAQDSIREPEIFQLYPSSSGQGEVAFLDTSGQVLARLRGFERVALVEVVRPNQFLVVDEGRREIILIESSSASPRIVRTWALPETVTKIAALVPLPHNGVVLLDKERGLVRLNDDSTSANVVVNNTLLRYESMGLFADGRLVIVGDRGEGSDAEYSFVDTNSWQATPLDLSPSLLKDGRPLRLRFMRSDDKVYAWELASHDVCALSVVGPTIERLQCQRLPHVPALILRDSANTFISLVSHGFLSRYGIDEKREQQISLEFIPSTMVFEPTRGLIVAGHQRQQINFWPDPRLYAKDPKKIPSWGRIALWAGLSFITILALYLVLKRFLRPLNEQVSAEPLLTFFASPSKPPSFLIYAAILIALEVARHAQFQLLQQEHLATAGIWYALGALLFAGVTHWWYRKSSCLAPPVFALPAPKDLHGMPRVFIAITVIALMILACLIVETKSAEGLLTYKSCLWFSSLAIVTAWLCLDLYAHRASVRLVLRNEWFFIVFPLLVGSVTFLYRLTTLPVNTHFDFSIPGLWAWQIATGREVDLWRIGYTPVPVFGLLPDILGMLVFGGTPFGYRIGPALFGLSGLIAVYILGREYQKPGVGFWAALFLAGNVPYIHFSRMSTCGTATTSMFWVLAFFVLAWRYNWSSLWMMTGISAGFVMYQWPVGRVGMAAIVLTIALVLLRHPRVVIGRWRGYMLGIVGFAVMIAPLVWGWRIYPGLMFPRAGSIDPIPSPYSGILGALHTTFGPQFFRCFGWFFFEGDHSSQGSMSPGLNQFEAVLFAFGLSLFLFGGVSVNLLLGVLLILTLVICGSFTRTAWYTRLLPLVVVSAIACAQAMEVLRDIFKSYGKRLGQVATVVMIPLVVVGSPLVNLKSYIRYESGLGRLDLMDPMVAIGRKIYELGPEYKYGLVVIGSPTWPIKTSHPRMLPFIMEREIHDIVELDSSVLDEFKEPYVLFVQAQRIDKDTPRILQKFPDAKVETIVDLRGKVIAQGITVNRRN